MRCVALVLMLAATSCNAFQLPTEQIKAGLPVAREIALLRISAASPVTCAAVAGAKQAGLFAFESSAERKGLWSKLYEIVYAVAIGQVALQLFTMVGGLKLVGA